MIAQNNLDHTCNHKIQAIKIKANNLKFWGVTLYVPYQTEGCHRTAYTRDVGQGHYST